MFLKIFKKTFQKLLNLIKMALSTSCFRSW